MMATTARAGAYVDKMARAGAFVQLFPDLAYSRFISALV
jgi:hypothetical protein